MAEAIGHFAEVLILLILFLVNQLGIGLYVAKKLNNGKLDLLLTLVTSQFLLFVTLWFIFVAHWPFALGILYSVVSVFFLIKYKDDLRALFSAQTTRKFGIFWCLYVIWILILLGQIRLYWGGGWGSDWYEHYERSLIFAKQRDVFYKLIGYYSLTARPPLMNLFCGLYLRVINDSFCFFQIVSVLYNSLVIIPALYLLRAVHPEKSPPYELLFLFLVLNPVMCQNMTYSWTRQFTNFFVLSGVAFYLAGINENKPQLRVMSLVALSLGSLAHYSAVPYLLFIFAHWIWTAFKSRRVTIREIASVFGSGLLILGAWFFWATSVFGFKDTYGSNTTVFESQRYNLLDNILKIFGNVFNTFVPHFFREVNPWYYRQKNLPGMVKDFAFLLYQTNFLFAVGLISSGAIIFLLLRNWNWYRRRESGRFWMIFFPVLLFLGIAVHGAKDSFGVTHVCLQPLVILALIFLASEFSKLNMTWRWFVSFGLLVDFILGAALLIIMEWNTTDPGYLIQPNADPQFSFYFGINYKIKEKYNVHFLGDELVSIKYLLLAAMILFVGVLFFRMKKRYLVTCAVSS